MDAHSFQVVKISQAVTAVLPVDTTMCDISTSLWYVLNFPTCTFGFVTKPEYSLTTIFLKGEPVK
jgi:hypothetical protein